MICKSCGRSYEGENKYCNSCSAKLDLQEIMSDETESKHYETNEGFSKPNSQYVKPQVIIPTNTQQPINHGKQYTQTRTEQQARLYQELKNDFQQGRDQQPQPNLPQKSTKTGKLSRKSLIGMIVALLIVALSIIVLKKNAGGGEFTFVEMDAIEVYVYKSMQDSYVFNAKGDMLYKIEKKVIPNYTPDHSAAILIPQYGGAYYYVNSDEMIELNAGIKSYAMSEDGNYIAYSTFDSTNMNTLYLYDVVTHSEKMIGSITDRQYSIVSVEPGGKTIIYLTSPFRVENNEFDYESFILVDGQEPESLGKDMIVFRVSKDMKYYYYLKTNEDSWGSLYVKSDKGSVRLTNSIPYPIYINKDNSEILFTEGESTYISVNGYERQKVVDTLVTNILTPKKAIINYRNNKSLYISGFDTLKNKVIQCNSKLQLIDKHYKIIDIGYCSADQQYVISKDGTGMLYRNEDRNLMKVDNLTGSWTQKRVSEEINASLVASNDLTQVYFLKDQQLYYMKGSKKPAYITDNASDLYINQTGDTAFFLRDYDGSSGTLYYSFEGGEAKPVLGGDDVTGVKEWNFGVIYQKKINGINTVFYNTKGIQFDFLIDRVDFFEPSLEY